MLNGSFQRIWVCPGCRGLGICLYTCEITNVQESFQTPQTSIVSPGVTPNHNSPPSDIQIEFALMPPLLMHCSELEKNTSCNEPLLLHKIGLPGVDVLPEHQELQIDFHWEVYNDFLFKLGRLFMGYIGIDMDQDFDI